MKEKILLLIFILLYIGKLYGTGNITGSGSLMFDSIGSRSLSLKESAVVIGEGPEAINTNPALTANINLFEAEFMYLKWIEGLSFMFGGISMPLPVATIGGVVGMSFTYFSSGEFERFMMTDSSSSGNTSANDFNLSVNYSRFILSDFMAGINVKYVQSRLDTYSSIAFCGDIGVKYILYPIVIGMSIQNVGQGLKYVKSVTTLPMNIKVGVGVDKVISGKHWIKGEVEYCYANDSEQIVRTGVEYSFVRKFFNIKLFSLRLGYQLIGRKNNTFSAGIGSEILGEYIKDYKISIDYALIPISNFGYNHAITITIKLDNYKELFGLADKSGKQYKEKNTKQIEEKQSPGTTKASGAVKEVGENEKQSEKLKMSNKDIDALIRKKEKEMMKAANDMDFIKAKRLKKEIEELKRLKK